jgi:hypothetical protein
MKKIWWSWDIRMRWAYGFSRTEESYIRNYKKAVDAARQYDVEMMVIWGFLRDSHGGIDAGRAVADYAAENGISILPGVGIDDYGGVYYDGDSPYSLDTYIREHPEAQARDRDGTPSIHRWPPTDKTGRLKGCPSNQELIGYYIESVEWLVDTFGLKGFQIEQGDSGLCYCDACRSKERVTAKEKQTDTIPGYRVSVSDSAERIGRVMVSVLEKYPYLTVLSETYLGLTEDAVRKIKPVVEYYPEKTVLSWQLYDAPGRFKIEEGVVPPASRGNAALRTNSDAVGGELDDRENISRALELSRKAGLEMTYIYGEYPDCWPMTRENYSAWAESASL